MMTFITIFPLNADGRLVVGALAELYGLLLITNYYVIWFSFGVVSIYLSKRWSVNEIVKL